MISHQELVYKRLHLFDQLKGVGGVEVVLDNRISCYHLVLELESLVSLAKVQKSRSHFFWFLGEHFVGYTPNLMYRMTKSTFVLPSFFFSFSPHRRLCKQIYEVLMLSIRLTLFIGFDINFFSQIYLIFFFKESLKITETERVRSH